MGNLWSWGTWYHKVSDLIHSRKMSASLAIFLPEISYGCSYTFIGSTALLVTHTALLSSAAYTPWCG